MSPRPLGAATLPLQDADHPIVLDMATSAIAWFNVKQAKTAGVSIPGAFGQRCQFQRVRTPNAI